MNSCKKQYFILEHRRPDYEARLRSEVQALNLQIESLNSKVQSLTLSYGAEVQFNAALCDLLRANGIPFRPVYEHVFRYHSREEA